MNKQLLLVLLIFSTYAMAQETGRQIEEVIVTAERQEASIQDTSISITAFTGEMIDDFGIRNQEDLQNFVPATTIQPYDATIRGVGRNFRALGGDPGVATYMNGVYSEDLLTATAATFWDVERVEVLRGPQGTLYGRNAVGGAINILYAEPSREFNYKFRGIVGNFGTEELYGMVNGELVEDVLSARLNFAVRDRDGVIDDIGGHSDLDGLGTENIALSLNWSPAATIQFDIRGNKMEIDRSFGGANGGGLVVLNEENQAHRNTTNLVPGYRRIDTNNVDAANYAQNDWFDASQPILNFADPGTGATVQAQHNRPGVDFADFDGLLHAAASLDGFGVSSPESAARYNECVFDGDIDGDDLCAATNGLNREIFDQQGVQFTTSWDVSDSLQLKYIYGYNKLSYQRWTDDDNTASVFFDRHFYVNHEARYDSHELQAFFDFGDSWSFTSGIFFYEAEIDQRGDLYSAVGNDRYATGYQDNSGLAAAIFGTGGTATLHSARDRCMVPDPAASCATNFSVANPPPTVNNNLHITQWYGDDGTNPDLNVQHGIKSVASDLLYHTRTERDAFAAYTQGVWDISDVFTLTLGIRYAEDEVTAEENLWRYSEQAGGLFSLFGLDIFTYNLINGGLVADASAPSGYRPTEKVVNGGIPVALSVYRPFKRKDEKVTGRVNLDWQINDSAMMYFSVTSGYRSGGYNLLWFSSTPAYDPEELISYEIGYKTQWLNDTLQINGSFYYYDYETIHTVATEVSSIGGTSTSTLEAPGAEVHGIEAEVLWLATDSITIGGNFSFTPSEYTEDLFILDTGEFDTPESLFPTDQLVRNIKGNQLLQVPEGKANLWGSYVFNLQSGSKLEFFASYSWIDEVYYSPFESEDEKAEAYGRSDVRATWTSPEERWMVSAFVNNITDEVGNLQILREGEEQFFRHTSGTTVPRLYGLEVTYEFN